jgi:2-polyprenyl-3-methyl-5-hydroxy-6-metoxy-1,4-benzoquinol methylase
MPFELIGDATEQDWAEHFNVSWAEYVQPIIDTRDAFERQHGSLPARCQIVTAKFNEMATNEDGSHNLIGVEKFYASDFFSRMIAFELGGPTNTVTNAMGGRGGKELLGEPIADALVDLVGLYGPNLEVLDCGFGGGQVVMRLAQLFPDASYTLVDFYSPAHQYFADMVQKYVRGTTFDFRWIYPGCQADFDDYEYDYIISNEVLEHTFDPVGEVARFANCLRPGRFLHLSTFFNSMNGHDPQHLTENDKYQDVELWFSEVRALGFRDYKKDPRGVLKTFERVELDVDSTNG